MVFSFVLATRKTLLYYSSICFQFVANGSVQPLLIAAGGGGSSDQTSSATTTDRHNARGLVNPWTPIENLLRLVSQSDLDAGKPKGSLPHAFATCVYCMLLCLQRNYFGWFKLNQGNNFENAKPCSKRTLEARVASRPKTPLFISIIGLNSATTQFT